MKYVKLGMYTALAMAISYAETFIPFATPAVGMKLGLANIILMLVLEFYGAKSALAVNVLRAVLSAALYGGIMSLPYSLMGGICAVAAMSMLRKLKNATNVGVAIGGAYAHNLAQTAVACAVMQTKYVFAYLPFFGIASVFTGAFTGIAAGGCTQLIKKHSLI